MAKYIKAQREIKLKIGASVIKKIVAGGIVDPAGTGLNVETIGGTKTLVASSPVYQRINGGASHRDIALPAVGAGLVFLIYNSGSTNNLVVKSGLTTLATLAPANACIVASSATAWGVVIQSGTAAGGLAADGSIAGATGEAQSFGANGIATTKLDLSSDDGTILVKDNDATALMLKEGSNILTAVRTSNNAEAFLDYLPRFQALQTVDMDDGDKALIYGATAGSNVKLSGNVLFVDPNGGAHVLTLPPVATSAGMVLDVVNAADASENVTLKNVDADTIVTIAQNKAARVACNGTVWRAIALLG